MTTPIERAQHAIAVALAALESETGGYVQRVDVNDIDVTRMDSSRQEIRRSVRIDIKPKPGTNWGV